MEWQHAGALAQGERVWTTDADDGRSVRETPNRSARKRRHDTPCESLGLELLDWFAVVVEVRELHGHRAGAYVLGDETIY